VWANQFGLTMKKTLGGWGRLYVIVALFWGAVCVYDLIESWPTVIWSSDHSRVVKWMEPDSRAVFMKGKPEAERSEFDVSFIPVRSEDAEGQVKVHRISLSTGVALTFGDGISPDQAEKITSDYEHAARLVIRDRQMAALSGAFFTWMIVCAPLFALGWAVRWVYEGFRQSRN
jgi:hypothetical protein